MRLIDADNFYVFSCSVPKKYKTEREKSAYIDGIYSVLEAIEKSETVKFNVVTGKAWDDEEDD